MTWTTACGDTEGEPCVVLAWSVCDADNDMLPGGYFTVSQTGSPALDIFPAGPTFPLSDFTFTMTPDFSNCDEPVAFGVGFFIMEDSFPGPGAYELVCDIEAVDNHGHQSNKLTGVTLQITY